MLGQQELAGVAPWFLELSGEMAFPRDGKAFSQGDFEWCVQSGKLEEVQSQVIRVGKVLGSPFMRHG